MAGSPGPTTALRPSFAGRLEDVSLAELLHFLSLNTKTGKLSLTRRDGHGLVLLRRGRIIYAASNSVRETFGNILVCRGLISEETLMEALERQQLSGREKRLGAVLVEMGKVAQEAVEDVVRYQTGVVLSELFHWTRGFFKFEAMEVGGAGEVEVDAQDFVVAGGFNTDRLLLEVATRLDELGRVPPEQEPQAAAPAEVPDLEPLDAIVDVGAPALRGEITLMLMRFATRLVARGVLFVVRGDEASGLGYFGVNGAAGHDDRMRQLSLSLREPSVLTDAIQKKESYQGPLARLPGNTRLLALIGGPPPRQVVAIPMVVGGSVAMVFYGDDHGEDRPLGSVRDLEVVITEAGLEMEKDALERRIRRFERARQG
jgi:hypothetical protein